MARTRKDPAGDDERIWRQSSYESWTGRKRRVREDVRPPDTISIDSQWAVFQPTHGATADDPRLETAMSR